MTTSSSLSGEDPNPRRIWSPAAIWRRLTEPAASIQQPTQRRQARLLASLLLVLIPIGIFVMIAAATTLPLTGTAYPLPFFLIGIAADAALYRAKREGRDRVVAASVEYSGPF